MFFKNTLYILYIYIHIYILYIYIIAIGHLYHICIKNKIHLNKYIYLSALYLFNHTISIVFKMCVSKISKEIHHCVDILVAIENLR